MAKNREFPGEYQSGSSWHETNIPLDSRDICGTGNQGGDIFRILQDV